jgi:hypothetical protein
MPFDNFMWMHMKDMVYQQKLQAGEYLLLQILKSTDYIREKIKYQKANKTINLL